MFSFGFNIERMTCEVVFDFIYGDVAMTCGVLRRNWILKS